MKFYDLFSGIGGFRLGLERAGFECVGNCEIDKYSNFVYSYNFNEDSKPEDVRKLDVTRIPEFDILTAGFPCQSFSVAGNEKGFNDDRGNLFFEIIKIAKEKKPSIILLENVKGLLSNDSGRTFFRILNELDAIGYDVQWQLINGKYFVPQNRERVFIVASLRERGFRKIFPIEQDKEMDSIKVEGEQKEQFVNCIDANYWKGLDKHGQRTMVLLSNTKANIKQRIQDRKETWTIDTCGGKMAICDDSSIRRLTVLECERLMGFPDNWTSVEGVSDTQRYKMLGNAVIPQIVELIGSRIK